MNCVIKVKILGRLLACSRFTVIYTGAGLSTASGVRQVGGQYDFNRVEPHQQAAEGTRNLHSFAFFRDMSWKHCYYSSKTEKISDDDVQAAEGAGERVEGFGKKTEAEPTLSHFALSALVSFLADYHFLVTIES